MNRKTLTVIAAAGLGPAGLVLILLSVFAIKGTLTAGLLCVTLGMLFNAIRTFGLKKGQ